MINLTICTALVVLWTGMQNLNIIKGKNGSDSIQNNLYVVPKYICRFFQHIIISRWLFQYSIFEFLIHMKFNGSFHVLQSLLSDNVMKTIVNNNNEYIFFKMAWCKKYLYNIFIFTFCRILGYDLNQFFSKICTCAQQCAQKLPY